MELKISKLCSFLVLSSFTTLARVITGYRIRNGEWTLLGKGDPQAPQVSYNQTICISPNSNLGRIQDSVKGGSSGGS